MDGGITMNPDSTTARPGALRTVLGRCLLLVSLVVGVLAAFGSPASADPLPLSPVPTAEISCDSGGVSTLTIHWGVGEYGSWRFGGGVLGDVSGPGGVFTAPTDETFTVPAGWQAMTSTFRLNRDTVGDTSYNQEHVNPEGAACPFATDIDLGYTCSTSTLVTSIAAGHVTQLIVYDDVTGDYLTSKDYPRYNLYGQLVEDIQVGPVDISTVIPSGIQRVRVEVTVDNTVLSETLSISCATGCVRDIDYWSSSHSAPLNQWPLTSVVAGSTTYSRSQAQTVLRSTSTAYQVRLRQQVIVAKLNQARGASYGGLVALLGQADAELTAHPSDSGMSYAQKQASRALRIALEDFNEGRVTGVPRCGGGGGGCGGGGNH